MLLWDINTISPTCQLRNQPATIWNWYTTSPPVIHEIRHVSSKTTWLTLQITCIFIFTFFIYGRKMLPFNVFRKGDFPLICLTVLFWWEKEDLSSFHNNVFMLWLCVMFSPAEVWPCQMFVLTPKLKISQSLWKEMHV